jgi:hypothetical protein
MSIFLVSVIVSTKKCICTCVLFRMVSEIELFHCTVHCTLYRRATRHVFTRVAVLFRTVSEIELFHCTVHCIDEQHAMSSHGLQSGEQHSLLPDGFLAVKPSSMVICFRFSAYLSTK